MKYLVALCWLGLLWGCTTPKQNDSYPIIHLNPDDAETLKMSDYFDGYKIIHFQNAICNTILDMAELPDHCVAIAKTGLSTVFQAFDKQGKYLHPIGSIGRGPGEYLDVKRDLVLDKDSNILLLTTLQCLKYSAEGEVTETHEWKANLLSSQSPQLFLNDTTVISCQSTTFTLEDLKSPRKKKVAETYFLTLQTITGNKKPAFYFPASKWENRMISPLLYQYRDSCYFYFDADPYIYRILPQGPVPCYQVDKGKHTRLKSFEEYRQQTSVPAIQMYILNESDRYLWGKYLFSGRYFLFFYDKTTGITQNFKYLDNDFIKTAKKRNFFPEYFHADLKGKLQCDPHYQYYYYTPGKFQSMIEYAKSKMADTEWQEYCQKNPELIKVYEELNEDSNMVVIGYRFK